VCMYVCMHICMYVQLNDLFYQPAAEEIDLCVCVCMYICVFICVCVQPTAEEIDCVYVCIHIYHKMS
jgi:hypothetical protein